jgi:hypothetical protein
MHATLAVALLVLSGSGADPVVAPAPPATPAETRWYGAPILLSDALSIGLAAFAVSHDNGKLLAVAGITWVAGPPLVHALEGEGTRAVASGSVRLFAPLIGAALGSVVGAGVSGCGYFGCSFDFGEVGFLAGAVVAVLLDQTMTIERPPPAAARRPPAATLSFAPVVQAANRSFGAAVRLTY